MISQVNNFIKKPVVVGTLLPLAAVSLMVIVSSVERSSSVNSKNIANSEYNGGAEVVDDLIGIGLGIQRDVLSIKATDFVDIYEVRQTGVIANPNELESELSEIENRALSILKKVAESREVIENKAKSKQYLK